jgi:tRNA G18 (ribose-2'-O)-methylase SpoU
VALEQTESSISLTDYVPQTPMALVLGHEVDGVSDDILSLADEHVHIDMYGRKESLNVSVAAGIAMHYMKTHIHI